VIGSISDILHLCCVTVHSVLILCYFAGEEVQITYSYWDGSGHRRHVKVHTTAFSELGLLTS